MNYTNYKVGDLVVIRKPGRVDLEGKITTIDDEGYCLVKTSRGRTVQHRTSDFMFRKPADHVAEIRPSIVYFSKLMEAEMRRFDKHYGRGNNWRYEDGVDRLLKNLNSWHAKLQNNTSLLQSEAAVHIANYCMMIWDYHSGVNCAVNEE